jgi:hypothetical protein
LLRIPPSPNRAGIVTRVRPVLSLLYHSLSVAVVLEYAPMLAISMPTERWFDFVACQAASFASHVW